jgi:hypothetical protein
MMENLKALISGRKLTNYQRALANREFEGMLKTIEMYEKTLKNNAISPHVSDMVCDHPEDRSYQHENGYHLIPMNEIDDEAREIAVRWHDNATNWIGDKHKLASDIMNYAKKQIRLAFDN